MDVSVARLAGKRFGAFLDALAHSEGFRVKFKGLARDELRVFMLRKVAGDEPTPS